MGIGSLSPWTTGKAVDIWVVMVDARSSVVGRHVWLHIAGGPSVVYRGVGLSVVITGILLCSVDVAIPPLGDIGAYLVASGKDHDVYCTAPRSTRSSC